MKVYDCYKAGILIHENKSTARLAQILNVHPNSIRKICKKGIDDYELIEKVIPDIERKTHNGNKITYNLIDCITNKTILNGYDSTMIKEFLGPNRINLNVSNYAMNERVIDKKYIIKVESIPSSKIAVNSKSEYYAEFKKKWDVARFMINKGAKI